MFNQRCRNTPGTLYLRSRQQVLGIHQENDYFNILAFVVGMFKAMGRKGRKSYSILAFHRPNSRSENWFDVRCRPAVTHRWWEAAVLSRLDNAGRTFQNGESISLRFSTLGPEIGSSDQADEHCVRLLKVQFELPPIPPPPHRSVVWCAHFDWSSANAVLHSSVVDASMERSSSHASSPVVTIPGNTIGSFSPSCRRRSDGLTMPATYSKERSGGWSCFSNF